MTTANDIITRTAEIRDKYEQWWRNPDAQQELKAIWGDTINDSGVFVNAEKEILFNRDGYKAEISIGSGCGLFTFGCGYQYPTGGCGSAPSIWDEMFESHGQARTAAIRYLVKKMPEKFYPHENHLQGKMDRMRQTLLGMLNQPSLF